jgi:hypothetical protein
VAAAQRAPWRDVPKKMRQLQLDLSKIVNGHPDSRIGERLPWARAARYSFKDVA